MLQPDQVQEPFQEVVDFIGNVSLRTGIDQQEFYRYLGSLESPPEPPAHRTADEFIKNLNGRLPSTSEEIMEAIRLSEEDFKFGRTMSAEEMIDGLKRNRIARRTSRAEI